MEMQLDNVTGNHRIAVTIREFSRMVGLSEPSIRGYLMRDPSKLPPTFRVGIRILFRIDDIELWLKNSPTETPRSIRGPGRPRKTAKQG